MREVNDEKKQQSLHHWCGRWLWKHEDRPHHLFHGPGSNVDGIPIVGQKKEEP